MDGTLITIDGVKASPDNSFGTEQLATESTSRAIDINAHIINLEGKIDIVDGNPVALISFDHLGYGHITAIKLQASGYNSFGDKVLVADKNQFVLVIQDISIPANGKATGLKADLPSSEIRKIEVQESQVCFDNGTILNLTVNETGDTRS